MWIFKPKDSPILSQSRFLHLFEAGWFTFLGGSINYQWGAFSCFGVIFAGFLWEIANKYIVPGDHRFGDYWDFLFFVFGAAITGALTLILRSLGCEPFSFNTP